MSHRRLLLEVSEDRRLFACRNYDEMLYNVLTNIYGRENQKTCFLQLVKKNRELSEIEKQYCREKFIYNFEINNAANKLGKPRECNKCKIIRYSDRFCEECISLHLQSLFDTWTSGNKII